MMNILVLYTLALSGRLAEGLDGISAQNLVASEKS